MKAAIHPNYTTDATILCACGNTFQVGSTVKDIHVELCSACHPFYTGKQKLIDTSRRIEKFQEKATKVAAGATGKKAKTAKRTAQKDAKKAAKAETKA